MATLATAAGFGGDYTGVATVGYTVYGTNGAVVNARTTIGVVELGDSGAYCATFTGGASTVYWVVWDDGGTPTVYSTPDRIN